jgi:predicted transcriptional regulator
MVKRKATPRPTDAELAILRALWDRGPSTVRTVHEAIDQGRRLQYTTTLKLLQIMTGKGLVLREAEGRSHIYRARYRQEDTQRRLVDDLLDRAFGGSAAALVMQALRSNPASEDELAEISRLIDDSKREKQTRSKKKEEHRG